MSKQFKLCILTPDGEILNKDIERIVFRTIQGDMAVMKGHAPFTCVLATSKMKIKTGEDVIFVDIENGFAEIYPDRVMIITDDALILHEE